MGAGQNWQQLKGPQVGQAGAAGPRVETCCCWLCSVLVLGGGGALQL